MSTNPTPSTTWRAELTAWLKENKRTMPEDLRQLHQEFLRRFPREHLREMTLEEYALGHPKSRDSFCYWLEWQTEALGSVRGGSSAKWGCGGVGPTTTGVPTPSSATLKPPSPRSAVYCRRCSTPSRRAGSTSWTGSATN